MAAKHIRTCLLVCFCQSICSTLLCHRHQETTFLAVYAPFWICAPFQNPIISLNHLCTGGEMLQRVAKAQFVLFCFFFYILHLFNKYIWSKTYVNSLIVPRLFVSGMNAFDGLTPGWASWRIQGNFSNFEGLRSSSLLLLCHTSSDTCGWAYFSKVTSWPIL